MKPLPATLPLTISEAAFQKHVIDCAHRGEWMVSHQRRAKMSSGKWGSLPQPGTSASPI